MASTIDIINRGLTYIGDATIASMADPTPNAEKVRRVWPESRDTVFRDGLWKCLQKRVALARLADAPAFGFKYQFKLPTDFIRVVRLHPEHLNWQVEGEKILTDESALSLAYIARITDSGLYDPALREALACRLAADLCFGNTASTSLWDALENKYRNVMATARNIDAHEGTPANSYSPSAWAASKLGGY